MRKWIVWALLSQMGITYAQQGPDRWPAASQPASYMAGTQMEQAYRQVCQLWSDHDPRRLSCLQEFLQDYPDTPYAYRIEALIASTLFDEGRYDEALEHFNRSRLELLPPEESYEMKYRWALCTSDKDEALLCLKALQAVYAKRSRDCQYQIGYIHYSERRYGEALSALLPLTDDPKYGTSAPYYVAECYVQKRQYTEAQRVAEAYLKDHPEAHYAAGMHRILGTTYHYAGRYAQSLEEFRAYRQQTTEDEPLREACYLGGLSAYQCGAYTTAAQYLGEAAAPDDQEGRNAAFHLGLAYVQLADWQKALLAFSRAADPKGEDAALREQAAYNHALCLHRTGYSAFGANVRACEQFLNDFPHSVYTDRISQCLVEVYTETRSYEAALQSIQRINRPSRAILEAKQRILFQLGTQAVANGRLSEASDYFSRSLATGNYDAATTAEARYWQSEIFARTNRQAEALEGFLHYLRLARELPRTATYALAHYNLGYLYFHQKQYDTARRYFELYLTLQDPADARLTADTQNRLGDTYLAQRQIEFAARCYAQVEMLANPPADYACYQLARIRGLQKDYTGKASLLSRLSQRWPTSVYAASALYDEGRAYVQAGDNQRALQAFSRLVAAHPNHPTARKALAETGLIYYQAGDYDHAIEAYRSVITHYPGSEEARLAARDLKSLYVDANRVEQLADLARQMPGAVHLEAGEQDSLAYTAAKRLEQNDNPAAFRQSLEHYLQSYPQGNYRPDALYDLSLMDRREQNDDQLLSHTTQLLEMSSRYTEEALLWHAEVLFRRQQYAEALPDYQRLLTSATTPQRQRLARIGILRTATLTEQHEQVVTTASELLADANLPDEERTEALYRRAKALLATAPTDERIDSDLRQLSTDTRTAYGAEAKYLVSQRLYDRKLYAEAEKELLQFIDESTPHAYWLARGFVLLADVYLAMEKPTEARLYLQSLQQNYEADDDIARLIEERLSKL